MKVLAIAGSLRAASINSALCRAAARLAPPSMVLTVYGGLGALPLFNPDLEASPPVGVRQFREAVDQAQALLIASPEYAHGVSGAMKNALDWLVSFEGMAGKPIALLNASPRAHHAYESLAETLRTMSTCIVADASGVIDLPVADTSEECIVGSPHASRAIRQVLAALARHRADSQAIGPSFPIA